MGTNERVPRPGRARLTRENAIEFVPDAEAQVLQVPRRRSVLDFDGIAAAATSRVPRTAAELDVMVDRGMTKAAVARAGTPGRRFVRLGP